MSGYAATAFGMSPAFVGFGGLVGAAAEMAAAFSAARKNRLDFEREHCTWQRCADCALRCSGSGATELFYRPSADGLNFWPGAISP